MQSFRIEFDNDMKLSMNKLWSGGRSMQWVRKALANDWHYWSEKAIEDYKLRPVKGSSIILFYFKFKKNMLDSSNVGPMAKCIEDTLTESGILLSDTNADVKGVYYSSVEQDKKTRDLMSSHIVDIVILEEWDAEFEALNKLESIFVK